MMPDQPNTDNTQSAPPTPIRNPHSALRNPQSPRFPVLDTTALWALPKPEWLAEGWLVRDALNLLSGRGGGGKSFLALDLALRVASGRDWHGRALAHGPVIYIAAEGAGEIVQRLEGWQAAYGVADVPGFYLVPVKVPLLDPTAVADLVAGLPPAAARPALIVIDTLAKSMSGGDENATRDMNRVVDACDDLRLATGATVLIVHHTGKGGEGPRGSSALEWGVRSALRLIPDDGLLRLECAKHNLAAEPAPVWFRLAPAGDTCIPVAVPAPDRPTQLESGLAREAAPALLPGSAQRVLQAIGQCADGTATMNTLRTATAFADSTIHRALKDLQARGYVQAQGMNNSKFRCYQLTPVGQTALTELSPITITPSPSPIGVHTAVVETVTDMPATREEPAIPEDGSSGISITTSPPHTVGVAEVVMETVTDPVEANPLNPDPVASNPDPVEADPPNPDPVAGNPDPVEADPPATPAAVPPPPVPPPYPATPGRPWPPPRPAGRRLTWEAATNNAPHIPRRTIWLPGPRPAWRAGEDE